jgi:hypothetical protein
MELTSPGENAADLLPPAPKAADEMALAALRRAWEITAADPDYPVKAELYLKELREDQLAWGERSP